jgi:hypothetical protein
MMCVGDVDSIGVDSRYGCLPGRAIEPTGQPRPRRVSLQRKSKEHGKSLTALCDMACEGWSVGL